jgi:predicted Rossmann fold nucleotide-binding protein DprA/Smf involved in DNA uptake
LGEYNKLARILREQQKQPADLIGSDAQVLIEHCAPPFGRTRLEALLGRGFLLGQAVERWNARAIWVISRADSCYPKRLKTRLKEEAPPLLYGCGEIGVLEQGGLAVVGSRHVDDELISFTEKVGRLSAQAHQTIISGGAKGIDRAAMNGALLADGAVAGVMADSLERAALARDNREPLMAGRLVLISPYDPAAGFNVGHAMQRNKVIYALADAGLVVTADFEKGGTWTGAIEQLERFHFVPVFVKNGNNAGRGNAALIHHGGRPWPNPENAAELGQMLAVAVESLAAEPKQEVLSFALRESPVAYTSPVKAVESFEVVVVEEPKVISSPADELFKTVREILRRELMAGQIEAEIVTRLGVTQPQAKVWLNRLVKEGTVEKVAKTKPVQYRTATTSDRLFNVP